jgi:hypothetical protein
VRSCCIMYLNNSCASYHYQNTLYRSQCAVTVYLTDLDVGGSSAWTWAQTHKLVAEAHLNRCRYWLPTDSALESEFVLRYAAIIHRVPEEDYV